MNSAQLHLVFTHLPIIGLGFTVLVNFYAILRKSEELQKLTLWCYLLLGILGLLAYITGDPAGEMMETYPGITENIVEPHENFALVFFIGLMAVSVFSIIGLYLAKTRGHLLKRFALYLFIAALVTGVFGVITGYTGGTIRHTEIKQGEYKK
jgi:uncharacterized membrane protein